MERSCSFSGYRIQKRYIVLLTSCLVIFSMHVMRDTLVKTAPMYISPSKSPVVKQHPNSCNWTRNLGPGHKPFPKYRKILYKWTQKQMDQVLPSFYLGLCSTLGLGGVLSDKFGSKYIVFGCILTQTVMTILGPVILQNIKGNWEVFLAWNIMSGLVQGPVDPAIFAVFGQWIPFEEKTIAIGLMQATVSVSYVTFKALGIILVGVTRNWASAFYVFGSCGTVACLLWFWLMYPNPESHPTITVAERNYLRGRIGPCYSYKRKRTPWVQLLKSVPVWVATINFVGLYWVWFTTTVELRQFLREALKIDFGRHYVLILFIPNIFILCGYVFPSLLCDFLINRRLIHITTIRKIVNSFGSMGAVIFTITASYISCNQKVPVTLFSVTMFFQSIYYTAACVVFLDLAPNFGGTMFGFANMIANGMWLLKPLITQTLSAQNSLSSWRSSFGFSLGICTLFSAIFALAGKATEQRWNVPSHLRVNKDEFQLRSGNDSDT